MLLKAFNGHMVCYIAINNFLLSFEISGGSYNPLQNTLRLINEFKKYTLSFMESLIAILFNFQAPLPNFYFCLGDWAPEDVCTQFCDFTNISSISKSFDNS